MSAPFDLSDALKKPPVALKAGGKPPGRRPPVNVQVDDFARRAIWVALAVCLLTLLYLFWGMYGGTWADPKWKQQNHDYHLRQLGNIAMVADVLRFSSLVLIVAMVIVFRYDEGAGYTLLGTAAVLYACLPLITHQVFYVTNLQGTDATQSAMANLRDIGLLYGVPGLIWSIVDIVRRFKTAAEAALIKQANQKYSEARTGHILGVKSPTRRLTPYQKKQRQYQVLAVVLLIGEPVLAFANLGTIQGWVQGVLNLTEKLSFTSSAGGIAQLHGDDGNLVLWTLLIAFNLVFLSQALRLLEYLCFRDVV